LIRNNLANGGNWLKVQLIAANGQAGAFGARVRIYEPGARASGRPSLRSERLAAMRLPRAERSRPALRDRLKIERGPRSAVPGRSGREPNRGGQSDGRYQRRASGAAGHRASGSRHTPS
jgi:hypothetical protein